MKFKIAHTNFNVKNLKESLEFYNKALGMEEKRRYNGEGFTLAYIGDETGTHLLELTELDKHPQPYDLGENEIHFAFTVDDFDAAYEHHKAMDCICYENKGMGIYFIKDPDGYWLEIMPTKMENLGE